MTITVPIDPAGPPKRQIIELAFGDCAMAGYEFGRTPEEIADALNRLNAMMYEWPFSALGYEQPTYGTGQAEDLSGIPYSALGAVAAHLALRIAPMMGATLSPEARGNLVRSMSLLHATVATIPTMPMASHTPRGMGARSGFGPFIDETIDESEV